MIQSERIKCLNTASINHNGKFVVYWMQSSVRTRYNHALTYAIMKANELKQPLIVYFGLVDSFPEANLRHYRFLAEGLYDVKKELERKRIKFIIAHVRSHSEALTKICAEASVLVTDRGYLKIQKEWRREAATKIKCAFMQIESDVVVPVETASNKEEFAARTIRPKITKLLRGFLIELPECEVLKPSFEMPDDFFCGPNRNNGFKILNLNSYSEIKDILDVLNIDRTVRESNYYKGGQNEAERRLAEFIGLKLEKYAELRNDPSLGWLSEMSPYLHFGNISPLKIAIGLQDISESVKEKYLEEVIVRRELAVNFCEYNSEYDTINAIPDWAKITLEKHSNDTRGYVYDRAGFEMAMTHDHYWNAAQLEMTATGKMHNYMRMYWGKKIIEWSRTPEEAFETMIYLNNKYELDGRDPNSFTGVAWCFGKHDRPWFERPVLGNLRYMNENGLKRKFNIDDYVKKIAVICQKENIVLGSLTHLMSKNL